jgi:hypothetical protein
MRQFLHSEKGWREELAGSELVFVYRLVNHLNIAIKVYTGIKIQTEFSRPVGEDAIRICAVNTATHQGWVKSSKIYRVEGWKKNLKEKILLVIKQAKGRLSHGR